MVVWKGESSDLVPCSERFSTLDVRLHFLCDFYMTNDGYCFPLGSWPRTLVLQTAPLAALEICHHSALSEYSVNRDVLPWFFDGSPFWAKQNISVGLKLNILCLFFKAVSIRTWWMLKIPCYWRVNLCGKPREGWWQYLMSGCLCAFICLCPCASMNVQNRQ